MQSRVHTMKDSWTAVSSGFSNVVVNSLLSSTALCRDASLGSDSSRLISAINEEACCLLSILYLKNVGSTFPSR